MSKLIMFIGWVWLVTCIAGCVMRGNGVAFNATVLTANLSDSATTITVRSTEGFPEPGVIFIGGERINYSSTTPTTFTGNPARPLVRGAGDTDAVEHLSGAVVRTEEASLVNNAMDYDLAVINDAAGAQLFFSAPVAVFDLIFSFCKAPLNFLGTDLELITYVWGICIVAFLATLWITVAGGRRA